MTGDAPIRRGVREVRELSFWSRAVAALTDFDHESVFESILLAGADPTREVRAAAAKGLFKLNFGRADALKRIIETRDGFRVRHAGRAARDSGIAEKAFERLIHEDSNVAYEAIVLVAAHALEQPARTFDRERRLVVSESRRQETAERTKAIFGARSRQEQDRTLESRLQELGSRPSVLNPAFYAVSYALGAATALLGDRVSLGFVEAIALGVLCNALVCLAVWLTYGARTTTDKLLAVVPPIAPPNVVVVAFTVSDCAPSTVEAKLTVVPVSVVSAPSVTASSSAMNEPARPARGTKRRSISLARGSAGSRASRMRLAPFSR
jgi:hypothetical protein